MFRTSSVTVLLVLLSLGVPGCLGKGRPPASAVGEDLSWRDAGRMDEWLTAYGMSGFGWCDAEVLAAFWGHSVQDAKARAGMKLSAGASEDDLRKWTLGPAYDAAMARGQTSCDPAAEGYTAADFERVGALYGVSAEEAREMLGSKLFYGGRAFVDMVVQDAYGMEGEGHEGYEEAEDEVYYADKFWQHDFEWCDALVLAQAWGLDTWQAKVSIGQKLAYGQSAEDIERYALSGARQAALDAGGGCSIYDGGYAFEDAEALACYWGVDLDAAKVLMSRKITLKRRGEIDADLERARQTCPG